ncbi:MAG: hypothetical protein HYR55_10115 [Acidobacteria bacterium]|nr:hypothetical protein [Acidobacteriota bacterium]MBI3658332.1 hypothetical protein [Acidobacteriota bacterium]
MRLLRYLAVLPIAVALMGAYRFFIALPLYDYWDAWVYSLICRDGGLKTQLAFFWEAFVDQRMVFPKITIALLSRLPLHQHFPLEIALGFAARLIMLYLVGRFIHKMEGPEENKIIAWLAGAFLLFWPLQQIIFQHHWYSTQYAWTLLPGVGALYFLDKFWGRWAGIGSAALACAVSSFSHGTGLPLWAAIGAALLPNRDWSGKQKLAWWLISGAAIIGFQAGLPSRADLEFPPLLAALASPRRVVKFSFLPLRRRLIFYTGIDPPAWQWEWPLLFSACCPSTGFGKGSGFLTKASFPGWFSSFGV